MGQSPASWDISELEWASVTVSAKTTWLFVRVTLNDGTQGFGEATRFGAEEGILAELALARSLLVGRGLSVPGGALAALRMAHASDARNAAMNGIEQALLDASARRAGMSLGQMLGGCHRASVPAYANINRGIADRSSDGFARRAREVVTSLGYDAIKIAPFDGLNWRHDASQGRRLVEAGIDRILAVREAIGTNVRLLVDCHWRLSPVMAAEVLRATGQANLFWIEDALDETAFDATALRALRGMANSRGVRTAGGEKLATLAGMRDHIALGGSDVVLPDLRVTGVRQGIAMLDLAVAGGVEASLHNPVGPVLDAISLQVAAALPSVLILEGQVGESPLFDEIAGERGALAGGARMIPSGPGSGRPPKLEFAAGAASARVASFAGMAGAGPDG